MEQWRKIEEAPDYAVSDLGRVMRVKADSLGRGEGLVLATPLNDKGYCHLNLHIDRRQYLRRVHRLVCEAFHGPTPSGKPQVRHLDGDKMNNRADNVCWGTNGENSLDAIRISGGAKNLSRQPRRRLSLSVICDIKFSGKSHPALVREHGVSKAIVWKIKSGLVHKKITAEIAAATAVPPPFTPFVAWPAMLEDFA